MASEQCLWIFIIFLALGHISFCENEEKFRKSANLSESSKGKAANDEHQKEMDKHNTIFASKHFRGGNMGCTELRSKRYISDGHCTSVRPISDKICSEWCLQPILAPVNSSMRINYAVQMINYGGKHRKESASMKTVMEKLQCTDSTYRRRVKLLCRDGTFRFYHIRVVHECICTKKQDRRPKKSARLINGMERIQKLT